MKRYIFSFTAGNSIQSVLINAENWEQARNGFYEKFPGVQTNVLELDDCNVLELDDCSAEPDTKGPDTYRDNIVELIDRQREKGLKKYGQTLEQNTTLSTVQRIEHAQEELVDALQYLEHLKQTQANKLTVADYERSALRTLNPENADRFDGWGIYMEAALGLTGEAGEAVELVKKSLCQGHELDKDALALELGDVAWYLTLFCNAAGLTLEEVLNLNTKKRAERYPEGFDKARSINREEGQKNG